MPIPEPVRLQPEDPSLPVILDLVRRSFAFMDQRIDPPSSMHLMTVQTVAEQCATGEVWSIGEPPCACMFLKERDGRLYLGKLAVDEGMRGKGLARRLVDLAAGRAAARGMAEIELETRMELVENHRTFERLGFRKVGEGTHAGYDRPTFIVMRKQIREEASPS